MYSQLYHAVFGGNVSDHDVQAEEQEDRDRDENAEVEKDIDDEKWRDLQEEEDIDDEKWRDLQEEETKEDELKEERYAGAGGSDESSGPRGSSKVETDKFMEFLHHHA